MLVIGIDPGTAATGYGLVREGRDGELAAVDFGVIHTSPDLPMPQRLAALHKNLLDLLFLHHPESGAVEKLFFQRNTRTALSVGQGRGVVLLALAESGVPVVEYAPMEVKQALTGYGSAGKKQIQEMVRTILNLKELPQPDDAADALAVAICHLHSARMTSLLAGKAESSS